MYHIIYNYIHYINKQILSRLGLSFRGNFRGNFVSIYSFLCGVYSDFKEHANAFFVFLNEIMTNMISQSQSFLTSFSLGLNLLKFLFELSESNFDFSDCTLYSSMSFNPGRDLWSRYHHEAADHFHHYKESPGLHFYNYILSSPSATCWYWSVRYPYSFAFSECYGNGNMVDMIF